MGCTMSSSEERDRAIALNTRSADETRLTKVPQQDRQNEQQQRQPNGLDARRSINTTVGGAGGSMDDSGRRARTDDAELAAGRHDRVSPPREGNAHISHTAALSAALSASTLPAHVAAMQRLNSRMTQQRLSVRVTNPSPLRAFTSIMEGVSEDFEGEADRATQLQQQS
eukprot:PhM_4_TR18946/c0_g1_i1/m.59774